MSSKLLRRGDGAAAAVPIEWATAHTTYSAPTVQLEPLQNGTQPPANRSSSGARPPGAAAPPSPDNGSDERIRQLEAALAEAKAHLERAVQEARTEGQRQGDAAARQAVRAEIDPVLAKMAESIRGLAALRPRLRLQAEADLVKLAVAIARRILHRELNTDEEAVAGLVRVALEKLRQQEVTRVRVHSGMRAGVAAALERSGSLTQVELTADPSLPSGGLVFETSRGDLDVSADTMLHEIERGLTDRFRGREA
jgi:flagellar assembly protein FliH